MNDKLKSEKLIFPTPQRLTSEGVALAAGVPLLPPFAAGPAGGGGDVQGEGALAGGAGGALARTGEALGVAGGAGAAAAVEVLPRTALQAQAPIQGQALSARQAVAQPRAWQGEGKST